MKQVRISKRLLGFISGTGWYQSDEEAARGGYASLLSAIRSGRPNRGGVSVEIGLDDARELWETADFLQSASEGGWGDPDAYADRKAAISAKADLEAIFGRDVRVAVNYRRW